MPDQPQLEIETAVPLFDNWFDPIKAGLRDRARDMSLNPCPLIGENRLPMLHCGNPCF
jgi:hypothetical protein